MFQNEVFNKKLAPAVVGDIAVHGLIKSEAGILRGTGGSWLGRAVFGLGNGTFDAKAPDTGEVKFAGVLANAKTGYTATIMPSDRIAENETVEIVTGTAGIAVKQAAELGEGNAVYIDKDGNFYWGQPTGVTPIYELAGVRVVRTERNTKAGDVIIIEIANGSIVPTASEPTQASPQAPAADPQPAAPKAPAAAKK